MELLAGVLDGNELGASTEPHLLRDAAHRLLLRDRHREPLAALRATATKHLATATGLLARTEPVSAFTALVVRLVGALAHGYFPSAVEVRPIYIGSGVCGAGSILSCVRGVKTSLPRGFRGVPETGGRGFREAPDPPGPRHLSAPATAPKRDGNGSSIAVCFVLQSDFAICYLGQRFSCGQLVTSGHGRGPEVGVNNFWIGCSLPVIRA